MTHPKHWEPPDPPKLLVSARRVAVELEISPMKANELCWSLERVFYGPDGRNYRVTFRSLMRFKTLIDDEGLSFSEARSILAHETRGDEGWSSYVSPRPWTPDYMVPRSRSRSYGRGRRW